MKICASMFLLLLVAAPAALADSVSILSPPSKAPFINYQIPSGGTAMLQKGTGPAGNVRYELSGQASNSLYTFTFDFGQTSSPADFYAGTISFVGNGVNHIDHIIQAHINSSGVMSGGWTNGFADHGRFTLQLYYNGSGCSPVASTQCLTLGTGTFSVATTPEPASVLLLGTGLVAMLVMMRRKARAVL